MPFEFTSPDTIENALELKSDGARWFAGGTDVIPEFKAGLANPTRLVNLKRLGELRGINPVDGAVEIGALATMAEIAGDLRILHNYTALAQACDLSASPQIRNMATIGGNLCQDSRCLYYRGEFHCYLKGGEICYMREGENHRAAVTGYEDCMHVHPSDPANALVALDAEIMARGPAGDRTIRAGEFFRAPKGDTRQMNILAADEFIRAVRLPRVGANTRSIYLKAMERATWTFALASACVCVAMDGEQVHDVRVVLGGVSPVPWREMPVEDMLRGARLDEQIAARVSAEALRGAHPLAHNAYKIQLARALLKRALLQVGGTNGLA